MPALASELRKTLENTVVDARDKAERGARDALTALAVAASEPYASMSEEERKLRNRLRARGRQLGDQRDPQKGTQSIERLVREMAYEHWHRMLFARFLAENQLLIEPSSGVAITLDECEELAGEEGTDLWGMAAQFAQEMLPQIFRTDDPVLALKLPLEIRQQLQALVAGLDIETFTANDSLGWTYQFWQTKRKKEVNDSGVKIGADEISPVTQLFTEDYMVDFLLDNTLGAWHAGKMLAANPELASTSQSEDDLRQAVALPGCPWNYLRFVKSDDGTWAPAAGTFEGWPSTAAELKCLDPCMGSGHFVVAMFERLVALRLAEGEQMEAAAVAAVIESNLFGLEIDSRCTQIAAFNLALAAWRRVGHCKLPAMNLACSGLAPNTNEAEWVALAGDNERLRNGMARLYTLFNKAAVLESLINPRANDGNLLMAEFHELRPLLEQALAQETEVDTSHEMAVTARGLAKAAEILTAQFTLVATNVPFLGYKKQVDDLRAFCNSNYPNSEAGLETVFIERVAKMISRNGIAAFVSNQTWTFQPTSKALRISILNGLKLSLAARLGTGAFETITGEVVNVCLMALVNQRPAKGENFFLLDLQKFSSPSQKAIGLLLEPIPYFDQSSLAEGPGAIISSLALEEETVLSNHATAASGLKTGDRDRFNRNIWEINDFNNIWEFYLASSKKQFAYTGRDEAILWERDTGELAQLAKKLKHLNHVVQNYKRGQATWGKHGIAVSATGKIRCSIYCGEKFDSGITTIIPNSSQELTALFCYCESGKFEENLRRIDSKLSITTSTTLKVPFDLAHWQKVAAEKYPRGLPKPFSSDATQWLFNGHPARADQPLHVAVARLVGYLWPRQTGSSFPDCPAVEPDGLETLADEDGIVCLAPVRGEASAVERVRRLLTASLREEWSSAKERELLLATAADNNAKKAEPDLESWLRNSFFREHCQIFHSRPFVWQVWDSNPHGFSALVNYHKLAAPNGQGRKTLELLIYTYLGDWIDRQKLDQAEGINGADDRLAAALDLQGQLKKILEGEPPYDIFVRWKPLHQQSIGWDPDINDGVRLNIRPFLNAQLRKGGKAGAGILRAKPGTIKWKKDRGKEPMCSKEDFPWFWGWDETNASLATDFGAPISGTPSAGDSFNGNRWNDLHYTRAAKEAARARHRGEG